MTVYPPTPPQQRLLWFLEAYSDEHGLMPTIREMAAYLGTKSTSTPFHLLEQLESKGHITRMPGKDRAIALVPQVDLKAENERLRAALQDLINANFDADAQRAGKALEHAMAVWAACAPPATCDSLPPATRPAVDSGGM